MEGSITNIYIVLAVIMFLIIGGIAILIRTVVREKRKQEKTLSPGVGITLGMIVGIPLGVATDNIALGAAIGVAMGLAIEGSQKKWSELTKEENSIVMGLLILGVILLVAAAVVVASLTL